MKLARVIHALYFAPAKTLANGKTRWGLPAFFVGAPGVAKTSFLESFAEAVDDPCEVLSGAERGEGAFGVIPVPDLASGRITYPAPDWTARFTDGGLVFLDEISSNPPIIQAPCMGLLLDRRIGSHKLNERTRVWAAMNPASIATNGYDISIPLANRGGWFDWEAPTVEEHVAYMLGRTSNTRLQAVDARQEEARVLREWDAAFARAVGLETSFLSAQADWKNKMPKVGTAAASRAWPSDRTWEMATRALASAFVHGLSDSDRDVLVAGFIGEQAFEAFATFIEKADLPNAGDVLDGKVIFKHDGRHPDRSAAVLNSCVALISPKNAQNRQARAAKLWSIMSAVGGDTMDIVVPAATQMINENLHAMKEAIPLLSKLNPILQAAGIQAGKGSSVA